VRRSTVGLSAVAATRGAEASAQRNEALKKQAKLLGKATGVNRCAAGHNCDTTARLFVNCEEVTNRMECSTALPQLMNKRLVYSAVESAAVMLFDCSQLCGPLIESTTAHSHAVGPSTYIPTY
jgi:hypothetical protein